MNWVIHPRGQPLVGYVQATLTSNRSAHVAYVLASKYWGHGYAQNAMLAMLEHLASAYDVDRCIATVEVENQRSIRLLERLRFRVQLVILDDAAHFEVIAPSSCAWPTIERAVFSLLDLMEK